MIQRPNNYCKQVEKFENVKLALIIQKQQQY